MADLIYNSFKADVSNGLIDLTDDTIKILLVTSSYTPDIDAHTRRSDVTNEVVGTGYTAGGNTLAGKSVTQDNTNDRMVFDATNPEWTSSTITARAAVVYKDTGAAATDNLICYLDFTQDESSSSGTFTVNFNAVGILTLT